METVIEPASLSEAEEYFQLFRSPAVCEYMDLTPFEMVSDAFRFLEFSDKQREQRKSFRYSLRWNEQFVGTICVYSVYWHQNRASLGYALKQEYWGKGLMSRSLGQVEDLLQRSFDIHRVQATVLPDNVASKRLLEKRGFSREGLLKHYEKWEGKGFVDLEMYGKILGLGG